MAKTAWLSLDGRRQARQPRKLHAQQLLDGLRRDWEGRFDEVARAAISLAPLAIRLARVPVPIGGEVTPQALAHEMNALRAEMGNGITDLHEALFAFVLAERTERRSDRDSEREAA